MRVTEIEMFKEALDLILSMRPTMIHHDLSALAAEGYI